MNMLLGVGVFLLGLLGTSLGLTVLRNGKIYKQKRIPKVYLTYFCDSFFGYGKYLFGPIILVMSLGLLANGLTYLFGNF